MPGPCIVCCACCACCSCCCHGPSVCGILCISFGGFNCLMCSGGYLDKNNSIKRPDATGPVTTQPGAPEPVITQVTTHQEETIQQVAVFVALLTTALMMSELMANTTQQVASVAKTAEVTIETS